MRKFIFDVDGTLTPSRGSMDQEFQNWFEHFATHSAVYLVTGSDRSKTLEQIPLTIYNLCVRVYQCSGNDVWEQNKNIRTEFMELSDDIVDAMNNHLTESKFPIRTGTHIDIRPGLVNFSVIGRGCTKLEREQYVAWDDVTSERSMIAENLTALFPQYNVQVAGETGIDITLKGKDKAQILKDFDLVNDRIFFAGDKMEPGGNDYTIGFELATKGHDIHQVKEWKDTWELLKNLA